MLQRRGTIGNAWLSVAGTAWSVVWGMGVHMASSRAKGVGSGSWVVVALCAALEASAGGAHTLHVVLLGDWRFDAHMVLGMVLIAGSLGDVSGPCTNEWALQGGVLHRDLPRG